jgi:hypothetical protein
MSASPHGSTPAAWTGVVLVTIAFIIGTLALILANWTMFWAGVGLLVLGGIVPLIMGRVSKGRVAH